MRMSRKLRDRLFYKVFVAGAQVDYTRTDSYRAADEGIIPTEWHGRFRLVPKKKWDPIRKKILRGKLPMPRRKPAAEHATAESPKTTTT
jgi:hypothetical protein